ncbi:hypothetical protein [Bartonella sp. HY406]|uniref:hypothetical protein n=1 Tax=Bartonella sp. HY406 TaxID=2979331 RepID=UPI0021C9F394|nr:hypothetical protein [Bartonella sp. HY406]UXN02630.1 hypothetical protein N6B01_09105 [Bartonella sp. HY406]
MKFVFNSIALVLLFFWGGLMQASATQWKNERTGKTVDLLEGQSLLEILPGQSYYLLKGTTYQQVATVTVRRFAIDNIKEFQKQLTEDRSRSVKNFKIIEDWTGFKIDGNEAYRMVSIEDFFVSEHKITETLLLAQQDRYCLINRQLEVSPNQEPTEILNNAESKELAPLFDKMLLSCVSDAPAIAFPIHGEWKNKLTGKTVTLPSDWEGIEIKHPETGELIESDQGTAVSYNNGMWESIIFMAFNETLKLARDEMVAQYLSRIYDIKKTKQTIAGQQIEIVKGCLKNNISCYEISQLNIGKNFAFFVVSYLKDKEPSKSREKILNALVKSMVP